MIDELAWAIQRIRDIQKRVLALEALSHKGCICPPGAEKTCEGLRCPRRKIIP